MLKVGLTGGIATGKSYIVSVFSELGAEVCEADKLAHAAIASGEPAYYEIINVFGRDVLAADEEIDRSKLGRIVFADAEARKRLNAIVHPRIFEAEARWFAEVAARRPDAIAVFDAALIIETESRWRFDVLIVVHCAPELQLTRLMTRNGLSQDEALKRINAQMPSAEKLEYADYVIDTSRDFDDTRCQVEKLYTKLQARPAARINVR